MLTCLRKAGVFKSGLHIFRHSFGDYLHELGYSIQTISAMLGHSNIKITYDFYFREHDQTKKEIADEIFKIYAK
jgi:integrase